jgi:ABC-type branched-subunit amino acid transport system substrate-binding protein
MAASRETRGVYVRRSIWVSLLLTVVVVAGGCARSNGGKVAAPAATPTSASTQTSAATSTGTAASDCNKTPLQATDVGITPTTITVEVEADVGSPLAPGLFQGNFDAMNAYATYINAHGGIACRKLVVKTWDTKLDPTESKDGLIDACSNAFALVGNNALFNPDVSPMTNCVDKSGKATGLPDIAALANDTNEQCAPTAYVIQAVSEHCPITLGGPRPETAMVGPTAYYLKQQSGLHGVYMVPGDLPTTVQSSTYQIAAQESIGIKFDATPKVSGADQQPAYTPRIQILKADNGNYVYDGSNDVAMIRMMKEAKAQGVDMSKVVWACSLACYTKAMLAQGGADVEGAYVWMQFLPFEEASMNAQATAYTNGVGANKVDSFGAQAWQAAGAFTQAANDVVAKSGPNGLTRAALLADLATIKNFTDDGWMGAKDLRGFSPCYVLMQIQNGKFVRIFPTKAGTLDCTPSNVVTLNIDPAAAAAKIK